jgi:hypothetical protein
MAARGSLLNRIGLSSAPAEESAAAGSALPPTEWNGETGDAKANAPSTSATGSETEEQEDEAAHRWAGKYDSPEALEKAYREAERHIGRLRNAIAKTNELERELEELSLENEELRRALAGHQAILFEEIALRKALEANGVGGGRIHAAGLPLAGTHATGRAQDDRGEVFDTASEASEDEPLIPTK